MPTRDQMNSGLVLNSAPAVEPLTTAEAKTHLRVDGTAEDTYIDALIATARGEVEDLTGRALITQTWDLWLDGWPARGVIELPRPPLQSVTSVVYYDVDDAEATYASSNYLVDITSYLGRIILNNDASWPTTTLRPAKSVRVRFIAGNGDASTDLHAMDIHATRLLTSNYYEHREPVITGSIVSKVPGLARLINRDRVRMSL